MSTKQETIDKTMEKILDKHTYQQVLSFNPKEVVDQMLAHLPVRMRNIIIKRFGIDGNDKMTLEKIGKKQTITRERVRQIEAEAIHILREKTASELEEIQELIEKTFKYYGHVLAEEQVISLILGIDQTKKEQRQALLFLMHLLPNTIKKSQTKEFYTLWATKKEAIEEAKVLISEAIDELQKRDEPHKEGQFIDLLLELPTAKDQGKDEHYILHAHIGISKTVKSNPYSEWGLVKWPEIAPRGVKDKAYLVTNKHGKPLHFTKIAEKINETKFDHKIAYPQTVHNELIKDERFVLVGRGIYALKEWGYNPGTVLEVIIDTMKKHDEPMTREEIMEAVMKKRKVRRNTIVLNLQNSKFFEKIEGGRYQLKADSK